MTYCVAINVNEGLVLAADSRTSAGVDDVRTYRKQHLFTIEGDRIIVIMSAGNLATTQDVIHAAKQDMAMGLGLASVQHLHEAANYIGELSRMAQVRHAEAARQNNVSVESVFLVSGQIGTSPAGIYMVYALGNVISASPDTPYMQIGESKYGKPILDRMIRPHLNIYDAARCALVSLDSTMRSNLSVGPPVDLIIYRNYSLKMPEIQRLDYDTPYYAALKEAWGLQLEKAFAGLPRFTCESPLNC